MFDRIAEGEVSRSHDLLPRAVRCRRLQFTHEEFGRLVRHIVENEYLYATTIELDPGIRVTAESVWTCVLWERLLPCDEISAVARRSL